MLTMSDCVAPDRPGATPESITAGSNIVATDYFATFGIPLVRGREFSTADGTSTPRVVIVNEDLARRYWPNQDPVGKCVRFGDGCENGRGTEAEIVGLAKNAQYASLDTRALPYIFYPFAQHYVGYVALLIRAEQDPIALASVLRKQLKAIDSRLRIYEIESLPNQMDRALWQTRWEASLRGDSVHSRY
jgi:putative ABC transport system permease protein